MTDIFSVLSDETLEKIAAGGDLYKSMTDSELEAVAAIEAQQPPQQPVSPVSPIDPSTSSAMLPTIETIIASLGENNPPTEMGSDTIGGIDENPASDQFNPNVVGGAIGEVQTLVTPEEAKAMPEMGAATKGALRVQKQGGPTAYDDDGSVVNWLGNLWNTIAYNSSGKVTAKSTNKHTQSILRGTVKKDGKEVPLAQLDDDELDYLVDSAGWNGWKGWLGSFVGNRADDGIMQQWDRTTGATIQDPVARKAARVKYAQDIARGMVEQQESEKLAAGVELENRPKHFGADMGAGFVETASYMLPYLIPHTRGIMAGIVEAGDRTNELLNDVYYVDDNGTIRVKAQRDSTGAALAKGAARGAIAPLVEKFGGEIGAGMVGAIAKNTLGRIPLIKAASGKVVETAAGKAVSKWMNSMSRLGKYTGMQSMPVEMLEEFEDQVLDAGLGLNLREGEKNGTTGLSRAMGAAKEFFKPENLRELAESMILIQVLGGGVAAMNDRRITKHLDSLIAKEAGITPEELSDYSLEDKQAAYQAFVEGLSEAEVARRFNRGAEAINKLANTIRDGNYWKDNLDSFKEEALASMDDPAQTLDAESPKAYASEGDLLSAEEAQAQEQARAEWLPAEKSNEVEPGAVIELPDGTKLRRNIRGVAKWQLVGGAKNAIALADSAAERLIAGGFRVVTDASAKGKNNKGVTTNETGANEAPAQPEQEARVTPPAGEEARPLEAGEAPPEVGGEVATTQPAVEAPTSASTETQVKTPPTTTESAERNFDVTDDAVDVLPTTDDDLPPSDDNESEILPSFENPEERDSEEGLVEEELDVLPTTELPPDPKPTTTNRLKTAAGIDPMAVPTKKTKVDKLLTFPDSLEKYGEMTGRLLRTLDKGGVFPDSPKGKSIKAELARMDEAGWGEVYKAQMDWAGSPKDTRGEQPPRTPAEFAEWKKTKESTQTSDNGSLNAPVETTTTTPSAPTTSVEPPQQASTTTSNDVVEPESLPKPKLGSKKKTEAEKLEALTKRNIAKAKAVFDYLKANNPNATLEPYKFRYSQANTNGLKLDVLRNIVDIATVDDFIEQGLTNEQAKELFNAITVAYQEQSRRGSNSSEKASNDNKVSYAHGAMLAIDKLRNHPDDLKVLANAMKRVADAFEFSRRRQDSAVGDMELAEADEDFNFWQSKHNELQAKFNALSESDREKVVKIRSGIESKRDEADNQNEVSLNAGENSGDIDIADSNAQTPGGEGGATTTTTGKGSVGTGGSLAGNRHIRIDRVDGDNLTATMVDAAGKKIGTKNMTRAQWEVFAKATLDDDIEIDPKNPQVGDMIRLSNQVNIESQEERNRRFAEDKNYQAWLKRQNANDADKMRERYEQESAKIAAGIGRNFIGGMKVKTVDREYIEGEDGESDRDLRDPNTQKVVGTWNRKTNELTLFRGANASTLVHELGGHAAYQFAQEQAAQGDKTLLNKMNECIDYALTNPKMKPLIEDIRSRYPEATDEVMRDEIFAALMERNSPIMQGLTKTLQGKAWYNRTWQAIKDAFRAMLTKMGFNKADLSGIDKMQPEEFMSWLDRTMADGKRLGALVGMELGDRGDSTRKMQVGEVGMSKSKHASSLLNIAKSFETQNASRREIWEKTGWYRGVDNKWRYEIEKAALPAVFSRDDIQMMKEAVRLNGDEVFMLNDIPNYETLGRLYPQLNNIVFAIEDGMGENNYGATLTVDNKLSNLGDVVIKLNSMLLDNPSHLRSTLVHELQHVIQGLESFSSGAGFDAKKIERLKEDENQFMQLFKEYAILYGFEEWAKNIQRTRAVDFLIRHSTSYSVAKRFIKDNRQKINKKDLTFLQGVLRDWNDTRRELREVVNKYERTIGEVEARLTEARLEMSDKERRRIPPWEMYDTPVSRQIVRDNGERSDSFVGEIGASNAGIQHLDEAKDMESDGLSREEIWKKTGWWKGEDGKWRVEIEDIPSGKLFDSKSPIWEIKYENTPEAFRRTTLGQLIGENHTLFNAYPDLSRMPVTVSDFGEKSQTAGVYMDGVNMIAINERSFAYGQDWVREVLAHEIQHAIQAIEGHEKGSASLNREEHDSSKGEIEAYIIQDRLYMTPEERASIPPWETLQKEEPTSVRQLRSSTTTATSFMDDTRSRSEILEEKLVDSTAPIKSVQTEIDNHARANGEEGVEEVVNADGSTDWRNSTDFVAAKDKENGHLERNIRELKTRYIDPAMEALAKAIRPNQDKADLITDFNLYLQCKHAAARNRKIANDRGDTYTADYSEGMGMVTLPDGRRVGLSENVANQLLATMERKYGAKFSNFDDAAQSVYKMLEADLYNRYQSGLLSAEDWVKYMERRQGIMDWGTYIPLKDDLQNTEAEAYKAVSFSPALKRNEFMKAKGRGENDIADSPFAAAVLQAEQGIRRSSRNVLANVEANLAAKMNGGFAKNGMTDFSVTELTSQGQPAYAEVVAGVDARRTGTEFEFTFADGDRAIASAGASVVANRPDIHLFKRDGKLYAIRYPAGANGRGIAVANAFSGENMGNWGKGMSWVPKVTHWLSSMRTQYSPEFTVSNMLSDNLEALQALVGRYGLWDGGKAFGKALKYQWKNRKDLWHYVKTGEARGLVKNAIDAGILTKGGVVSQGIDAETKELTADLDKFIRKQKRISEMNTTDMAKSFGRNVVDYISMANSFAEYSTRIGIASALEEYGVPRKDAIKFARDATVNFNRKGTAMPYINGLYMFANAAVQGAMRSVQSFQDDFSNAAKPPKGQLGHNKHKGELVGMLVVIGVAKAILDNALGDDDEREKEGGRNAQNLSEYDRKHNVGLPIGGGRQIVPLRFRGPYAAIPYLAQTFTRYAMGDIDAGEVGAILASELGSQTTELIGGNGVTNDKGEYDTSLFMQSIAPTLVDPFVQMGTGKDYKGDNRLRKKFDDTMPDSSNGKRNTPGLYKGIAQVLNYITGGNENRIGKFDAAPENVQLLVEFIGGAPLRDINNVVSSVKNATQYASGGTPEKPLSQIPFVRRFVREYPDVTGRYYDAIEMYERDKAEYKKTTRLEARRELRKDKPYLSASNTNLDKLIERVKELTHLERGEVKRGRKWVEPKVERSEQQKENYRKQRLKLQATILRRLGE